uniref:Uncharacterized protein n=1 Tax=Thermofilum adornatum TaxID=1365176 RepID=A0A7C1GAA0_9CREN
MYAVETVDLTRTYVRYNYKGTRISMDADDNPGGLFLSLYNRYFNRNVVKEEVVAVDHVNIKIPRGESSSASSGQTDPAKPRYSGS